MSIVCQSLLNKHTFRSILYQFGRLLTSIIRQDQSWRIAWVPGETCCRSRCGNPANRTVLGWLPRKTCCRSRSANPANRSRSSRSCELQISWKSWNKAVSEWLPGETCCRSCCVISCKDIPIFCFLFLDFYFWTGRKVEGDKCHST